MKKMLNKLLKVCIICKISFMIKMIPIYFANLAPMINIIQIKDKGNILFSEYLSLLSIMLIVSTV